MFVENNVVKKVAKCCMFENCCGKIEGKTLLTLQNSNSIVDKAKYLGPCFFR